MKKFLFLVSFLVQSQSFAINAIVESDDMVEIYKKITENLKSHPRTLVVFDIDNTVLAMKTNFGSDQWFNWKAEEVMKKDPELFDVVLAWQEIAYQLGEMRTTEKEVPLVIKRLQDKRLPVFALTSRSPYYRGPTERELTKNNIDFSRTAIGKKGIPYKFIPPGQKREVDYMNGIFMTQGLHKGQMLEYIIRRYKLTKAFSQIVFIDDSKKNVDRVFESFDKKPIDILSILYTKEDKRVNEFLQSPRLQEITDKKLELLRETLLKVFKKAPKEI